MRQIVFICGFAALLLSGCASWMPSRDSDAIPYQGTGPSPFSPTTVFSVDVDPKNCDTVRVTLYDDKRESLGVIYDSVLCEQTMLYIGKTKDVSTEVESTNKPYLVILLDDVVPGVFYCRVKIGDREFTHWLRMLN